MEVGSDGLATKQLKNRWRNEKCANNEHTQLKVCRKDLPKMAMDVNKKHFRCSASHFPFRPQYSFIYYIRFFHGLLFLGLIFHFY